MSQFSFLLHSLVCCIFQIPHISDIIWYLSFYAWLISLSIMLSKFIHVVANGKILSFLWLHNILSHTHTYVYVYVCMCAKSFQSCPTIWNPMDCSPSDSSVHRILQARILEWIAMPSSRESSQPRDGTWIFKSPALAGTFVTIFGNWEAWGLF